MKSKQFCSVCKEWLEMEVVPTGDGDDDDGVVWYRCPQCQGFLPKLKGSDPAAAGSDAPVTDQDSDPTPDPVSELGSDDEPGDAGGATASSPDASVDSPAESSVIGIVADASSDLEEDLPWDSPADMMASQEVLGTPVADPDDVLLGESAEEPAELRAPEHAWETKDKAKKSGAAPEPSEPIGEYEELLAQADQGDPKPYRPWDTYEVGDCIVHLAWEDCGIVVAKEDLPGGRQVIKCFFGEAGVVRLIEKAPK